MNEDKKMEVKKAPVKKAAPKKAPVKKEPAVKKETVRKDEHPGERGKERIVPLVDVEETLKYTRPLDEDAIGFESVDEQFAGSLEGMPKTAKDIGDLFRGIVFVEAEDEASGVTSGVTSGVESETSGVTSGVAVDGIFAEEGEDLAPAEKEPKWYEHSVHDLVEPTIDTGIDPVEGRETDEGPATIVSVSKIRDEYAPTPPDAVGDPEMAPDEEDDAELMKDSEYMELWEEDLLDPSLYQYDPDRPSATIAIIVPPGWQDMQKRWFIKTIRMALWKRKEWHYKRKVITHNFGHMLGVFTHQAKKYNTDVRIMAGCVHNQPGLTEKLIGYLRGPDDLLVIVDSPRHRALVNAAIRRARVRGAEIMVVELEEKYKKYK